MAAPKPTPPPSRWRADLLLVVAATLACYAVSSFFEVQELLASNLSRLERWQADEIPLTLTGLACGLAWYVWRRRNEVRALLVARERADARVAELLERNRELARQLIALQESERRALARELHDELGQGCTAIRVETAFLRRCAGRDVGATVAAADRVDAAAVGLYALVRSMLRRLRPVALDTLGLAGALRELCDGWQERTRVACRLTVVGDGADALGETVDMTIYRVLQEALTNVARHADARTVDVRLEHAAGRHLALVVADDGRGMQPGVDRRGLGLLGAGERAAAVGGTLDVDAAPGVGVTITLRIPLSPAPAAAARPQPAEAEAA